MYPQGTIYRFDGQPHGEVNLHPNLLVRTAFYLLRGVGAGLIGFAVIAAIFTFGPIVKEELLYTTGKKEVSGVVESGFGQLLADFAEAKKIEQVKAEAQSYGVNSYFSVVIPKIGAASNIVANVSLVDKEEYLAALQSGVAHAKGTHFPGQGESIFLFSHSTDSPVNFARYNAVFYLLGRLEPGDRVIVFFADGRYEYKIRELVVTEAQDTDWLEDKGEEVLILQTCYPPGTSWKRQLVVAKPVNS
jgi:LPXTG-site transpeptidase (sortase) family protein